MVEIVERKIQSGADSSGVMSKTSATALGRSAGVAMRRSARAGRALSSR
jgi:hypothetical protein